MSAYTNLRAHSPSYTLTQYALKIDLLECELKFVRDERNGYYDQLRNIPDAIKEYGYIDVHVGREDSVRLSKAPPEGVVEDGNN